MVPFHLSYTSCNLSYFLPSINNLSNLNFFVFYICNFEYFDNLGLSFIYRIIRPKITDVIMIVTKKRSCLRSIYGYAKGLKSFTDSEISTMKYFDKRSTQLVINKAIEQNV